MYLPITSLFIGIFVPLYVLLSLRVVRTRRKNRIPLGDGGHPDLIKIISTHNNFSQYIPLALVCMGFAEIQGVNAFVLLGAGSALVVGRVSHAVGIIVAKPGANIPRVLGMVLTFTPLLFLALAVFFH